MPCNILVYGAAAKGFFMIGVGFVITIVCFTLWYCNHDLNAGKIYEYWERMKEAKEAEVVKNLRLLKKVENYT